MARDTATAQTEVGMTPEDVQEQHQSAIEYFHEAGEEGTLFESLFAPRARAKTLDVVIDAQTAEDDPALTITEIAERAGVDRATITRHIEPMEVLGVVQAAGKRGNAQTYELNRAHPIAQLLMMVDVVRRHGQTPMLLEEQFIGDPASTDGDGTAVASADGLSPEDRP